MPEIQVARTRALILVLSLNSLEKLIKLRHAPESIYASLSELNSFLQNLVDMCQPDTALVDGERLVAMWSVNIFKEKPGFFQTLALQIQGACDSFKRKATFSSSAMITAGIVIGDIVVLNDAIFGDAVNTASRYCDFAREVNTGVVMDESLLLEWPLNMRRSLKFYEIETKGVAKRVAGVDL